MTDEGARLTRDFGCRPDVLKDLTDPGPMAVALRAAIEAAPSCCITLDELTGADGRLVPDVAAILQKTDDGRWHAFLYRANALRKWIEPSPAPVNPANQLRLDPIRDIIRLS